jgi:dGTPase
LCNLADEIAYNAHDIDDGVRSGLITLEQLEAVALFDDFRRQALAEFPQLQDAAQGRRLLYEATRRMLTAQVHDVIEATTAALETTAPTSVAAVREGAPLVQFGPDMRFKSQALKTFLLHQLYRHPQVMQTMSQAQQIVHELFKAYLEQPQEMGEGFLARAQAARGAADARSASARVVADYIAGMTDRFAAREHERLTGVKLL